MRRRIALLSAALVPVLAALFIVRRSNVPKPDKPAPAPMDDQVTHPPSPSPTPTPTPREPGE
jgi:hypothetical protein